MLKKLENQDVEFKSEWKDKWLEWVCGMANSNGGIIYIGVDDKGNVVGVDNAVKLVKDIPNKIRDTMGILPEVGIKEENDKLYISIKVDQYPSPISYCGKIYVRSGSNNFELRGAELDKFMLNLVGKRWEELKVPEATYDDLSEEAFKVFRNKAKETKRLPEEGLDVDNLTLLKNLGLYDGKYFNKAAMLLFGEEPDKWVLNSTIKIGFFEGDSEIIYQDEVKGALILQVDRALDIIYAKYLKALIRYDGIQRVEEYIITKEAFREILLNSVNHKQYEECNPIQVSIYDDQIYIWNDANFPKDLREQDLYQKHYSKPYNPLIARTFFLAGYIESWGRGFEKIKEESKRLQTPLPEVQVKEGGVMIHCLPSANYLKMRDRISSKVIFIVDDCVSKNDNIAYGIKTGDTKEKNGIKTSDTKEKNGIKTSDSKEKNGIKTSDTKEKNGIKTGDTKEKNGIKMKDAKEKNSIKTKDTKRKNGIKTKYAGVKNGIKTKYTEEKNSIKMKKDVAIKNILECLVTKPSITISDISIKTNISVPSVKRYLRILKREGIIRRKGTNRRGYWEIIK